jgi:hypothetical protein
MVLVPKLLNKTSPPELYLETRHVMQESMAAYWDFIN